MNKNVKTNYLKTLEFQAVKKFLLIFLIVSIALFSFYTLLNNAFSEVLVDQPELQKLFLLYYSLFAIFILGTYFVVGVGFYRQIFLPLPQVLRRLQDIKVHKKENEPEDYFTELPDFWNVIEEEVLAIAKTIGRRQKHAERIRKTIERILDVFPEPTLIVGNDSGINYLNSAFKEIFGAHIEKSTEDLYLHDIFREPDILSMVTDIKSETIEKEVQVALRDSNQTKFFIAYKTPFATRLEDVTQESMVIFHDITSLKRTELMKVDFVSNVSHELRTPITSIQGYVKTLREDIASNRLENVDKFFGIVESQVDRLSLLIRDLLELSFLESSTTLTKTQIGVRSLTEKILSQFEMEFKSGEYSVVGTYDVDSVDGEPRLIEQILTNLIQNALRYTPPGTNIQVTWRKSPSGVELVFKDNGPGISEEHVDRLFERFYRVDPHRSRSRGGTGLGLSIVKHIMQRHDGSVRLSSKLGHGMEFICTFPDKKS